MKKTTNYVHQAPSFVTEEELRLLESFEKELGQIDKHIEACTVTSAEKKHTLACDAYRTDPSDNNFTAMKLAAIEERLLETSIIPSSVLSVVESIRDAIISEKIRPWVRPILDRGLKLAQERLDKITAEEAKRHKELVGQDLRYSEIIQAAQSPVTELEGLVAASDKWPGGYRTGIFAYLHAHAANGLKD